jgi:hypothetical protein
VQRSSGHGRSFTHRRVLDRLLDGRSATSSASPLPRSGALRENTPETRFCAWVTSSSIRSPPDWMMLRIALSGKKLFCFFSSSKMIWARVTVVRSSLLLLSTIFTSSPPRIMSAIWSSVT